MAPLYKKALVVGATSGIGAALASKLIANDTKVVVVGRRRDRLDAFVEAHGSDNASAVAFDVTNLTGIKDFADEIIRSNPDLDCVVISSGVQRGFNFSQPETIDLSVLGDELTVNYTSAVHLTASFLPHLKKEPHGNLVYISATLGLIPAMTRTPNYNASKAALHAFIMNVRHQLREAGYYNVHVVEVFPPAVQTELHDEKNQPDLVNGGEIGMPLAEFTNQMYAGLVEGSDQFAIGLGQDLFKEGGWEYQRGKMYEEAQDYLEDALAPYLRK
ncbi:hypothetical protein EDB81DRAFT_890142 [Dactylonectria macrodidyma]|uniref:Uncharacterized protein n=1 Tax=Dactylonectria macrodidyma TaxID=307937 RepID=A0A9P9ILD9_9HYPO|nr:hypothetical protein EDB81DRAFT_890142 [Dactylonectria macrodidyma]